MFWRYFLFNLKAKKQKQTKNHDKMEMSHYFEFAILKYLAFPQIPLPSPFH